MKKIAIIGSGALGSALANVLKDANKKNKVLIYGIVEQELSDLKVGTNTRYFGDYKFNKMETTNNLEEAIKGADYIVLAIPSQVMDGIIKSINKYASKGVLIINGCKGFYPNTETPLHSGIEKNTKSNKNIRGVVSLTGPSYAIEIIKRELTSIAAVGKNDEQALEVQQLFKTKYFKLYCQTDIVGAEVGGIYKNILAIGAGMLTQLGFKINTMAVYLTRGMKEMSVLNKFLKGKEKTIYGLTGLGDLILTATDSNSRNFTFGFNFAKGDKETKNVTLEGLTALSVVEKIRKQNNLYLPIQAAIYNVIFNNKDIKRELDKLWNSELKGEN